MSPPSTSPPPKGATRPKFLLPLLIGVTLLILLLSAIILSLLLLSGSGLIAGRNETLIGDVDENENTTLVSLITQAELTTVISTSETPSRTSSEESTETSTEATTLTSAEFTVETNEGEDVVVGVDVEALAPDTSVVDRLVQQCTKIHTDTRLSCQARTPNIKLPTEKEVATNGHYGGIQPLHYALNLSLDTIQPTTYSGSLELFVKVAKETDQIVLSAGRLLHVGEVAIVDCDGGKPVCVARIVHDAAGEALILFLSEALEENKNLRIVFKDFRGSDQAQKAIFSQKPQSWQKTGRTTAGSLFQMRNAREVFPCLDFPSLKASLSFCIKHESSMVARGNAEISRRLERVDGLREDEARTCFARTPPMSTYLFAFFVFDDADKARFNATDIDGSSIPVIEVIFPKQRSFDINRLEWVQKEAAKALALMTKWSGLPYPLEKLTLISAPIPVYGIENFGLASVQDRIAEYNTYTLAHVTLVHEVVHQWVGNVFTTKSWDDVCLQEALTTYLEWKINEQLGNINVTRRDNFEKLRLSDTSRPPIGPFTDINQITEVCFERPPTIFFTIDEIYGERTIEKLLALLTKRFAWASAGLDDWIAALNEVTGKAIAGETLKDWFTRTGRPVLKVTHAAQEAVVEQITLSRPLKKLSSPSSVPKPLGPYSLVHLAPPSPAPASGNAIPWTVTIQAYSPGDLRLLEIRDKTQKVALAATSDLLLLDPKRISPAVVVYDVGAYARLQRCWEDGLCGASQAQLKSIFSDFGAIAMADAFDDADAAKWRPFMMFLHAKRLLNGDVACCVAQAAKEATHRGCVWIIKDECEKVRLFAALAK